MGKIAICALLALFATGSTASAGVWSNSYKDIRRTGGHKRSVAAFNVDLRVCARVAGIPYRADRPDPPAFKTCMLQRGLRWVSTTRVKQRPAPQAPSGWHVCHYDCDNPHNPESGYVCEHTTFLGMPAERCVR